MFYTYTQNNSGGYFIQNEDVDEYVIIEGDTRQDIQTKSNKIFENYREYCHCCGERWDSHIDYEELDSEPMIYGDPVHEYSDGFSSESKAIIYYKGGTKEVIDTSRK